MKRNSYKLLAQQATEKQLSVDAYISHMLATFGYNTQVLERITGVHYHFWYEHALKNGWTYNRVLSRWTKKGFTDGIEKQAGV